MVAAVKSEAAVIVSGKELGMTRRRTSQSLLVTTELLQGSRSPVQCLHVVLLERESGVAVLDDQLIIRRCHVDVTCHTDGEWTPSKKSKTRTGRTVAVEHGFRLGRDHDRLGVQIDSNGEFSLAVSIVAFCLEIGC